MLDDDRAFIASLPLFFLATADDQGQPDAVSVMAAYHGQTDMAVGNAIGSCLFNMGFILGATAMVVPVALQPQGFRRAAAMFLVVGAVVAVMCLAFDIINRTLGLLLIVAAAAYVTVSVAGRQSAASAPTDFAAPMSLRGVLVFLAFGALGIAGGSILVVYCATQIALIFHVPQMIIALTLVAGGTSMPELVVSLTGMLRNRRSLSVGNILGANVLNLTWVLGASAVTTDVQVQDRTRFLDLPAMLVMAFLVLLFGARDYRLTRAEGALLVLAYCVYLALTFTLQFRETLSV